jgi:alanine racemase
VSDEDAEGREFTNKQYENFIHVRDSLKKRGVDISVVHCSNSGAIEDYPETCCDMVRAGIILYGLAPSSKLADRLDLVPAMTLTTISYGRTFTADRKMKIATVPIGYADGFIRQNAKDGYMTVNGKKAKIVGRICMDQTMLDVTDIEDVKTGDEVVVFGTGENGEPTADSLAENTGTINYETVCLVGKRVPRIYIKDGKIENVMYKL